MSTSRKNSQDDLSSMELKSNEEVAFEKKEREKELSEENARLKHENEELKKKQEVQEKLRAERRQKRQLKAQEKKKREEEAKKQLEEKKAQQNAVELTESPSNKGTTKDEEQEVKEEITKVKKENKKGNELDYDDESTQTFDLLHKGGNNTLVSSQELQNQSEEEKKDNTEENPSNEEDVDNSSLITFAPPKPTYSTYQYFAWGTHELAVGFVTTLALNSQVLPYIPEELAPLRSMFTAGAFTTVLGIHSVVHGLLNNQNIWHDLQRHGSAMVGFGHEMAKFATSLVVNSGVGLGVGYAIEHFNPILFKAAFLSGSEVAKNLLFVSNDLVITTAILGFTAFTLQKGIKWGYDRFKKTPAMGPEYDPTLSYFQSLPEHLGLRLVKDLAAYEAFKIAMTNYGLGNILINQPQVALLFAFAFDQLFAEPTKHLGHANKPVESLVAKPTAAKDGYNPINQDDSIIVNEAQVQPSTSPSKAKQVQAVGFRAVGVIALFGIGYGLTIATEKVAQAMGYEIDESDERQAARFVEVGALTIVAERAIVNFSGPVANKAMEGARYVGGALKGCGSAMFSGIQSMHMPSMPKFGRSSRVTQIEEVQDAPQEQFNIRKSM